MHTTPNQPAHPVMSDLAQAVHDQDLGAQMYALIETLYPICRSITGDGVRATLRHLQAHIDLQMHEVPTGTEVFDWTVPLEWNIRDAYIKDANGQRVVDFNASNLHVLNYSAPVHQVLPLADLKQRLYSLPEYPDWIPYRTSYYNETWGFCLSHNQLNALPDGDYEVCIDSTLAPGHLTYGEYIIPGQTRDEVLISCHVCHPSLCNDNLAGISVAVMLARLLTSVQTRYTYRFVFIPGTIGSITWLATHEDVIPNVRHGFVLTCAGDPGDITYKRTRRGNAEIDHAMAHVLEQSGGGYRILDFTPYGYDERQYCSPAFDMPVGVIMRSLHGTFPQYHTSADNLDLVQPTYLADTLSKCLELCRILESNRRYINLFPKGEPQLGKRGIYKAISGQQHIGFDQLALLWVLNYSDGEQTLLDIAERSGMKFGQIERAASLLAEHGLLAEAAAD